MSDSREVLSRPSGRGRSVGVQAVRPEADLRAPLYAVNLVDLVRPRTYSLYGLLAFPLARRAGARVLFKGERIEVLGGGGPVGQLLLIVYYPDAGSFLDLVTRPIFAGLSLLRRAAVERFRFALYEDRGSGSPPRRTPRSYRGSDAYLLRGTEGLSRGLAGEEAGRTFFAGRQAGILVSRTKEGPWCPTKLAPPVPWRALALNEGDLDDLRSAHGERESDLGALYHRRI